MNAISPTTAGTAAEAITAAGSDFVDGSILGPLPTVRPGATVYLSGPRATDVADLHWTHAKPVVVEDRIGAASAVKMSSASVYKGLTALAQVILPRRRTVSWSRSWPTWARGSGPRTSWPSPRPRCIVTSPRCARSPGPRPRWGSRRHFRAFAAVWADIADRPLADGRPETLPREVTARQVADGLGNERRRPNPGASPRKHEHVLGTVMCSKLLRVDQHSLSWLGISKRSCLKDSDAQGTLVHHRVTR